MGSRPQMSRSGVAQWSAAEIELMQRLKTEGMLHSDIAEQLPGRSRGAVTAKLAQLRVETGETVESKRGTQGESRVGWPVPNRRKEWPIGFFEGQDVSAEVLDREYAVIGRAQVFRPVTQTLGGVVRYGR